MDVTVVSSSNQKCLIKGKPDMYQPMDKDESGWEESDWANQGVFNCTWRPENVSFENGIMTLKLAKSGGTYPYASGEYRTTENKYSYGYYEVRMKAAKGAGLVAGSFFTYSGVFGQRDHNEIDFEILGKDPTKVQLNYYYAGTGTHDEHLKLVDLGFDASQSFHNYGFAWTRNSIEWYVDGKSVYKATQDIPKDPCNIMANFWPGTSEVSGWLGGVYNGFGGKVQYDWIKYMNLEKQQVSSSPIVQTKKPAPVNQNGTKIGDLVINSGAFGREYASVSGDQIELNGNSKNPGVAMELNSKISGKLTFDYSGKTSSGKFSVLFIKRGPGGDWTKDSTLKVESITIGNGAGKASIDIPAGTDKINIMLIGGGSIDIKLQKVMVIK